MPDYQATQHRRASRRAVLAVACALALLPGCFSLGSRPGQRLLDDLVLGISEEEAVAVVSSEATILSETEFTRGPDGSWIPGPDPSYDTASTFQAAESCAEIEARSGRRVEKILFLDRTWGWMGWDVFILFFDADGALLERSMIHLD
ncbi:MAG: hypothetical protein AAF682_13320 [Planctomycetota bacterium]